MLTGKVCIKFNYHMRGATVHKLSVYERSPQAIVKLLWEKSGEQDDDWEKAIISATLQSSSKVGVTYVKCVSLRIS